MELKGPVLVYDHVKRHFTYDDTEAYRLRVAQPTESRKWVIHKDQSSGRRRDLLIKMVATHLGTQRNDISPTPVTVYRIMGGRDLVPVVDVVALDILRLLMEGETTHSQARASTRNALDEIIREPKATFTAAATRLTDAFCGSVMKDNRLNATDMLFVRWYILEDDFTDLMQCLSKLLTPEVCRPSQRSTSTGWPQHEKPFPLFKQTL